MAVRIKFDNTHNVIQPTFVLATRSGKKLGVIQAENVQISDSMNTYFDLNFQVQKENNGEICPLWDKIEDFKLLWCREWDIWFEIYVETSEENNTVKNINAISLGEAETSNTKLYEIEINTETDISRDDYVITVLFNEENPKGSLLNRIMEKVPHYSIGHVDVSLINIQRTFTFDNKSLYDAFQEIAKEINCIFVFNSGSDENGKPKREINVYDLESYCLDCEHRDIYFKKCPICGSSNVQAGYGQDTTIFVSTDNLADNITFSTDKDSVMNCFRLEGGDDLMTATIRNCNPNGSGYIWYVSDLMRRDMSDELVARLDEYDENYDYYQNEHQIVFTGGELEKYNELVTKYHQYNEELQTIPEEIVGYPALMNAYYDTIDLQLYLESGLMPSPELEDTTATQEVAKLTTASLSPVAVQDIEICSSSTASSAVLAMAKVLVDPRYQVKVKDVVLEKEYSENEEGEEILTKAVWTGAFTVTNYSNEEYTATSEQIQVEINDDFEAYVKQKLEKALNQNESETTDIVSLFKLELEDFKLEIQKYCLASLETFRDACQTCIDILIEQGVANDDTWADEDPNLYEELYLPYHNKNLALVDEIALREEEIEIITGKIDETGNVSVHGLQTVIEEEKNKIQKELDFESFLGTKLWLEFISYRREDTYSNSNYISDGLDNKELFGRALQFIETARKEIYKSATLQHSITATLKNLLVMKEFKPITEYFAVGNWIRVRINDEVYRLRLISYKIDFNNLDNISIEFSDVLQCANGISDVESILNQAASMTKGYDSIAQQASKGNEAKKQVDDWVERSLTLTQMKIVNDADDQNITWDSHGILCRQRLSITDTYDDKQLKIINKGLYLTDDGWLTSKAGIGDFVYYDPETGEMKEAYGVIADTLVGNLILTEKVGVYNMNNSVVIDDNGITITTDNGNTDSGDAATNVFTIQKKVTDADGNEAIEQLMYVDDDGELVLNGTLRINSSSNENVTTLNDICDDARFNEAISTAVSEKSQIIHDEVNEQYNIIMDDVDCQLNQYKAEVGQYMQFDENGLTLGSTSSEFKTVIDNKGLYFKQGETTVSYVNNNQLYIPNAVIENTLVLGHFFFCPREDGGVSLTWQGEIPIEEVEVTAITGHPTSQTIVLGEYAVFNVTATGNGITYQWQYKMSSDTDWTNSTSNSAKTNSFTHTPESVDENGMVVRCVVTDSDGDKVYSKEATLYVTEPGAPITITSQPKDQTVAVGETATFEIVAEGEGLSYQWQYKAPGNTSFTNSTHASATTTTYQITPVSTSVDGEKIRCIITDSNGDTLTSAEATLNVTEVEVTLTKISATYSGGDVPVGTALTDLTGIVVTGTYSDNSTANITGYTLSGEIVEGNNTITVTYEGSTTTFTVVGIVEDTESEIVLGDTTTCVVHAWISTTARASTVKYADSVEVMDGAVSLVSPKTASYYMTTAANYSQNNYDVLLGKYVSSFSGDIYFIDQTSTYSHNTNVSTYVKENIVYQTAYPVSVKE